MSLFTSFFSTKNPTTTKSTKVGFFTSFFRTKNPITAQQALAIANAASPKARQRKHNENPAQHWWDKYYHYQIRSAFWSFSFSNEFERAIQTAAARGHTTVKMTIWMGCGPLRRTIDKFVRRGFQVYVTEYESLDHHTDDCVVSLSWDGDVQKFHDYFCASTSFRDVSSQDFYLPESMAPSKDKLTCKWHVCPCKDEIHLIK